MSKGSDPTDVVGAAEETGNQAMRLNEAQTLANRPNQSNAWGSTNWTNEQVWNPTTNEYNTAWTQNETLNPALQASVDAQQGIQTDRSELANSMMDRVNSDMSNPMDFDQYGGPIGLEGMAGPEQFSYDGQTMPAEFNYGQTPEQFEANLGDWRTQAEDDAYARSSSRLDPQFEAQEQALTSKLRNQGLSPGDQAYDAAMASFGRERTDAYEQARLGATSEGRDEASQYFGQQLDSYNANLSGQNQGYQQALTGQQQNAAQQNQLYQQQLAANQANNATQDQGFGQNVQQNEIANQLRTQQMQEDLYKRGYSLDEVERMLAGQAVSGGPPSSGGETNTLVGEALAGG